MLPRLKCQVSAFLASVEAFEASFPLERALEFKELVKVVVSLL